MKNLKRLSARLNPRQRRARQWKKLTRAAGCAGELPHMFIYILQTKRRAKDARRSERRAERRMLRWQLDVAYGSRIVPLTPAQMFDPRPV